MRRLWIDEFFYSYENATEWEDVPEPEKQKAIKTLKNEVSREEYSYGIDAMGKIYKVEPITCPFCGSIRTEVGDDYLYCTKCKKEVDYY